MKVGSRVVRLLYVLLNILQPQKQKKKCQNDDIPLVKFLREERRERAAVILTGEHQEKWAGLSADLASLRVLGEGESQG